MENFHRMDACPVRDVLSRLGDKWTMLVLVTLKANGTNAFLSIIQKTIRGYFPSGLLTVTFALIGDGRADCQESLCGRFLPVWSITLQKSDVA